MLAAFKNILLGLYDNQTPGPLQEIYITPELSGLNFFWPTLYCYIVFEKKELSEAGGKNMHVYVTMERSFSWPS